jgi:hypothetical protein
MGRIRPPTENGLGGVPVEIAALAALNRVAQRGKAPLRRQEPLGTRVTGIRHPPSLGDLAVVPETSLAESSQVPAGVRGKKPTVRREETDGSAGRNRRFGGKKPTVRREETDGSAGRK